MLTAFPSIIISADPENAVVVSLLLVISTTTTDVSVLQYAPETSADNQEK